MEFLVKPLNIPQWCCTTYCFGKTEWSGAFGGIFLTEGSLNWYLETKRWHRGVALALKKDLKKFFFWGGVVLRSLFAVYFAESSTHASVNIL